MKDLRQPFVLVPSTLPHDTVECLERALDAARRGQVLGCGLMLMLKGREYVIEATGEVRRNPTFARGMLAALDDLLRTLMQVRGKKKKDRDDDE